MQAVKRTITEQAIDLNIKEVTLLTKEQYEQYKEKIPPIEDWYWLKTPGEYMLDVAFVYKDGNVYFFDVNHSSGGLRPVFELTEATENLAAEDIVKFAGYDWTMLTDKIGICNEIIDQIAFNEDWLKENANSYEDSDIKSRLDKWAKDNIGE